jgi:hypothetical protein
MNTDNRSDVQTGAESKLRLKAETQKLIGFAFEVLTEVGHGLNEKLYENSLVVLFRHNNILFDQQRRFPVLFRGVGDRGHEGNRTNHSPRAWPDVELSSHY